MESCFGNYILLGKRADQPMLDVKAFKFIDIGNAGYIQPAGNSEEEKVAEIGLSTNSAPKIEDPKSEMCKVISLEEARSNELCPLPREVSSKLIRIHKKLENVLKLVEMMITKDIIDIKLYRTLDERQRSLANKMLSLKYQKEVLDLIETTNLDFLDLRAYLLRLKISDLREVLKTRFQIVINTISHSQVRNAFFEFSNNENMDVNTSVTHKTITPNNYETNPNSVFFQETKKSKKNTKQRTCESTSNTNSITLSKAVEKWKQSLPMDELKANEIRDWLDSSSRLITHIALVPSEVARDFYYNGWENIVRKIFWDKSYDLNSLYGKIKNRLKQDAKNCKLPLTLYEFQQLDKLADRKLASMVNEIESFCEDRIEHN